MSEFTSEPTWISIPLSSFQTHKYKIALNIRELTVLTNEFSKKYVGGCTPQIVKSYPKELAMQYRVTCAKSDSDPAGHEVRVKFDINSVTTSTTLNDLQIKVSCSCPAFLYWGAQWHLHQKDSLEGEARPKLQAPTEQLEKRNGYLICKHVHVVCKRVIPAVSKVLGNVVRNLQVEESKKREAEEATRLQQKEDKARAMRKRVREKNNPVKPKSRPGVIG